MLIDKIPARRRRWTWRTTQQRTGRTTRTMHWAHQRQRQRSTAAKGRIGQCCIIIPLSPTCPALWSLVSPAAPASQWRNQLPARSAPVHRRSRWRRAGRDDNYTNNNNNKAQAGAQARKVLTLSRELPALAEFLEAKAHMAHAASVHHCISPPLSGIQVSTRYPPATTATLNLCAVHSSSREGREKLKARSIVPPR